MKKIQLGGHRRNSVIKGYALVDDADFDELNKFKWYALQTKEKGQYYAARHTPKINGKRNLVFMHRSLLNPPIEMETDHVNRNKLDNRRENLRVATRSQNSQNRRKMGNSKMSYKGIYLSRENRRNKWGATIRVNGKFKHLGYYFTDKEASFAYDKAAQKYHKEFALTNAWPELVTPLVITL